MHLFSVGSPLSCCLKVMARDTTKLSTSECRSRCYTTLNLLPCKQGRKVVQLGLYWLCTILKEQGDVVLFSRLNESCYELSRRSAITGAHTRRYISLTRILLLIPLPWREHSLTLNLAFTRATVSELIGGVCLPSLDGFSIV